MLNKNQIIYIRIKKQIKVHLQISKNQIVLLDLNFYQVNH